MTEYDIYHQWLGIPKDEQPAHHYRLLGLALFESSTEVIRNAAERQMRQVRHLCRGEYEARGQELLNELAAAKICLLNPDKKLAYDEQLSAVPPDPSPPIVAPAPAAPSSTSNSSTPKAVPPPPEPPPNAHPAPQPAAPAPPATASDAPPITLQSGKTSEQSVGQQPSFVDASTTVTEGPKFDFPRTLSKWVIGARGACDLVVDIDSVSGIHCELSKTESGLVLLDLDSSNGTYVNGTRIDRATRVLQSDLITLSRRVRLKIPSSLFPVEHRVHAVFLGRSSDNELVIDEPSVSSFHARVTNEGGELILEDLGSSNGMFLLGPNGERKRITQHRIHPDDTFVFGRCRITSKQIAEAIIHNR